MRVEEDREVSHGAVPKRFGVRAYVNRPVGHEGKAVAITWLGSEATAQLEEVVEQARRRGVAQARTASARRAPRGTH